MKPKGLLIAVVLLAVLGGAVWWSNKKQATAAKNPTDTSPKIVAIPDDQVAQITIKHGTGEVDTLKRENGKWQLTSPQTLAADSDAASSLTSQLSSLSADKTIEDNASDLSAYGLSTPSLDVTVTKKDGK